MTQIRAPAVSIGPNAARRGVDAASAEETPMAPGLATSLLQLVPLPRHLARPLRAIPQPLLRRGSARLIDLVLAGPLAAGALDDLAGRSLGVEVTDLGLRWVVAIGRRRVEVLGRDADAESTVRGTATDLLLLASRLEDADTLFFQRRLQVTGDTELGLAVRNLLDQLPWETIPLGLRIALDRGAKLARAARTARRGGAVDAIQD